MKASTPLGAAALIRSATPSPYATGTTPWLFSHSWLLSPARPMTVAPVRRASWTASEPTPPAAPEMTTVSPSLGWTACTAPHAVAPATNRPPATSHETFSGLRVSTPICAKKVLIPIWQLNAWILQRVFVLYLLPKSANCIIVTVLPFCRKSPLQSFDQLQVQQATFLERVPKVHPGRPGSGGKGTHRRQDRGQRPPRSWGSGHRWS